MHNALQILQITLAVIITACILLQAQGSGLGTTWGGGGETYHTKRGVERVIFYLTIFCLALFTITSLSILVF